MSIIYDLHTKKIVYNSYVKALFWKVNPRKSLILLQKMNGTLNRSVLQGVLVEHSYLCSECKKVGHNIVYYDNIIVI